MGILNFIKDIWTTPPRHSIDHQITVAKRAYSGAKRGRLHGDWQAIGSSANAEVYSDLATLRNRSRDLCRNDDYARGIVRNIIKNVVFTGIGFQGQVKQLRGKQGNDNKINLLIEAGFDYWSRKKYCDVTATNSFGSLQQLIFRSYLESGEVFVRKINNSFAGCKIPFSLEVIEADQVDENYNAIAPNGNVIIMGVELNSWKRPVAYWMHRSHPGDSWFAYDRDGDKRDLQRVDAAEIIHLFNKERPGQLRGVPILYSTINRLRNLSKYEESELIAARAAASFMGIVTTPYNDLLQPPQGNNEESLPAEESLSPGVIKYLSEGEDFKSFTPNRPNSAFEGFHRNQLRAAAVGAGVSFEGASGDYSQSNYSSSRLSLLDVRDIWAIAQRFFIDNFLTEIYEGWLEAGVLSGYFDFPDYELNSDRYKQITWTPRGWNWVDPQKEIQATILAIKSGLTTLTAEVAKQGGDFEENIRTIVREREVLRKYGINLNFDGQVVHGEHDSGKLDQE